MFKKIIYLVQSSLNERDYVRFGASFFKDKGFDVEVWDITNFQQKKRYENFPPVDLKRGSFIFSGMSREFFIKKLKKLNFTEILFFDYCNPSFRSHFIYKSLKKNNATLSKAISAYIPEPAKQKKIDLISKLTWRKVGLIVEEKLYSIYKKVSNIDLTPSYLIGHGKNNRLMGLNGSTIIDTHAFDYDLYLKYRNDVKDKDYAVFIDECYPDHPDYICSGIRSPVDEKHYYSNLCNYFEYVESCYKIDVVIAAHPRSTYMMNDKKFGGRKVVYDQTCQLIRDSRIVLIHNSTSINFCVLFKKPMIFLKIDKCIKDYYYNLLCLYLEIFRSSPSVTIDCPETFHIKEDIYKVDKETYKSYKEKYIKTNDSLDVNTWDIVSDFLIDNSVKK